MTAFSRDEQWFNDLDWFAVDKNGRIGHFTTVGSRLLPPSVAASKEDLETLFDYFNNLDNRKEYFVCPRLQNHLNEKSLKSFDRYVKSFAEMASRGLYSYDSYDNSRNKRPYFRVAIPTSPLKFENLPDNISEILKRLVLDEISFGEDSIISEEITNNL